MTETQHSESTLTVTARAPFVERLLVWSARRIPLRRGKLRMVNWLWRCAAGGVGTRRLASLKYGGFIVPCDLEEMLQRQFYYFGTYFVEEENLNAWRKAAHGARVVFDVGANAGIYSLAALAVAPNAIVHAFEPTPEIAQQLREAASLNRLERLRVNEIAVSDQPGHAKLRRWRGESHSNGGMNFIIDGADATGEDRVLTARLDDFCEQRGIGRIDLMKIDVQGHEAEALRGAEGLLRQGRIGVIFLELNWMTDSQRSCPAAESIGLLEKYGYRFSEISEGIAMRRSGDWMLSLSDIVARPVNKG